MTVDFFTDFYMLVCNIENKIKLLMRKQFLNINFYIAIFLHKYNFIILLFIDCLFFLICSAIKRNLMRYIFESFARAYNQ